MPGEGGEAWSEKGFENISNLGERGEFKKCPDAGNQKEGIYLFCFVVNGQADPEMGRESFKDKENAVDASPENEIPARAVPESGEEHGDEKIEGGAEDAAAVAAEGNIDVIADPVGESDVPAAPEFRDALGLVGRVEIQGKVKAHEAGNSHGHE